MINEDTPVYKMYANGPASLSNSELLSLIIGGSPEESLDIARNILGENNNSFNAIAKLSLDKLCKYTGMTELKAGKIWAMLELGRRKTSEHIQRGDTMRSANDVSVFLRSKISDFNHELFIVVFLNKACRVLGHEIVGVGGIDSVIIDVRLILKKALEKNATGIFLSHNHPSGGVQPSQQDKDITRQIKEAAKLMDILVMDHIIITQDNYFSFNEEGIL